MTRDVSQIGFYKKKITGFHGVYLFLGLGGGLGLLALPT